MALNESVASFRKRAALANFKGSLLRRATKSASVQPSRFNSSPTNQPLRFGFPALAAQCAGVIHAQFVFHLLRVLLPKASAAQTPASPQCS